MEAVKALLPLATQASLFLLVLALGLRATPADAGYVFARPWLLLRSVVAISVVVPLYAVLLVSVVSLTPAIGVAILLMAVSPLPPLVPAKQLGAGEHVSYVCGMLAAISLLSVILVPATVAAVAFAFASDAAITPMAMARLVLNSVVLPLGIGIALNSLVPRHAARAAVVLSRLANILLFIVIVPVLLRAAPVIWSLVGNGTLLAIASVTIVGLAAGHILGGPEAGHRTALALASSTRHPGIALMIGRVNSAEPGVAAAVLLFVLVGLVISIPYQRWRKRQVLASAGTLAAHASR